MPSAPSVRVCSTTNNSSIITAPRIMSQAPRNARMMLKPQQVVTALCIMIKPLPALRTMLKVPRITLYRPRIMSQAPRIMLKAPRLSQASRILLNVSSTAYNVKSTSCDVACSPYIMSKSSRIMLELEAPRIM